MERGRAEMVGAAGKRWEGASTCVPAWEERESAWMEKPVVGSR